MPIYVFLGHRISWLLVLIVVKQGLYALIRNIILYWSEKENETPYCDKYVMGEVMERKEDHVTVYENNNMRNYHPD